jgi:hypothetical protein
MQAHTYVRTYLHAHTCTPAVLVDRRGEVYRLLCMSPWHVPQVSDIFTTASALKFAPAGETHMFIAHSICSTLHAFTCARTERMCMPMHA